MKENDMKNGEPKMSLEEKYKYLLNFAEWTAIQSCCHRCECISCEAVAVLRKIGEWDREALEKARMDRIKKLIERNIIEGNYP